MEEARVCVSGLQQSSADRFLHLFQENIKRDGADRLLEYLRKSDFFTAPASTKFHGAYEGGLVEHSVNVYNYLLGELASMDMTDKYSSETIAIVSLLHDVCKIGLYAKEPKNQKTYDPDREHQQPSIRFLNRLFDSHKKRLPVIIAST